MTYLIWVSGYLIGVFSLLAYMIYRMMKNPGWDDSNITNALRLLSHVTLHSEDFDQMYYLEQRHWDLLNNLRKSDRPISPFWYVNKDELSEVVKTRP